MRSDKIFDMIGKAEDKYIADAKRRRKPRLWAIPAAAVLLVCAITLGAFVAPLFLKGPDPSIPGGDITDPSNNIYTPSGISESFALLNAQYPLSAKYPADPYDYEGYEEWRNSQNELNKAFWRLQSAPYDFIKKTVMEFLKGDGTENSVYSPVNVYMALAMLAETADGESRDQLLALLGADSIDDLRESASAIFRAHYSDDGAQPSLLASSMWLDDSLNYNEETLNNIATKYFASSFSGAMGSEEYNQALRSWLNDNTGGLLSDNIGDIELDSRTVIAIATTVYFSAKWDTVFSEQKNTNHIFHGTSGDVNTTFMNAKLINQNYYYSENFSAVEQQFDLGGGMYFILPDKGIGTSELLSDPDVLKFICGDRSAVGAKAMKVNISVPKFDVSSSIDLAEGLKNLGVTDIFDPSKANFDPLTDIEDVFLDKAEHSVRVAIDEDGCTAAAYTVMMLAGMGMPPNDEIDFTVDRPFVFVITSDVGLPLFVGVVNNI